MQRLICFVLRLPWCLFISDAQPNETSSNFVNVQYEYQLEVNTSATSTEQVLASIDSNILQNLQQMLPDGGTTASNPQIPNVQFSEVTSKIYSDCFTESDQCSLVKTLLVVTYEGDKPENSVEERSYQLVQRHLDYINNNTKGVVKLTYLYPFLVSSVAQFHLKSVEDSMGTNEIRVMEESILDVFGAIVGAIEGDTEVTDVTFVYQDLRQDNTTSNWTMYADFMVDGTCRECSEREFASVINAAIGANLDSFEYRLIANADISNTSFFNSVDEVTFLVPKAPNGPPPMDDDSIYDSQAPSSDDDLPALFYVGISLMFCVLCSGLYILCKEVSDLDYENDDKSVFSTSSESDSESSDKESQIDRLGMEEYDVNSN